VIKLQETVIEAAGRGWHVVVPDAGHYIHFDRPRLVIHAVDDVVAEAGGRYTRRLRTEG